MNEQNDFNVHVPEQKKAQVVLKKDKVEEDAINLRDLWSMFMPRWPWFVLSLFIVLAAASFYLLKTPKQYSRTAAILIQDMNSRNRNSMTAVSELRSLGLFNSTTSINDELYTIQSPSLMQEVTKRLKLNEHYSSKQFLRPVDLYGMEPMYVSLRDVADNTPCSFEIKILANDKVKLSHFKINNPDTDEEADGNKEVDVQCGQVVKTPVGELTVTATKLMNEEWIGKTIQYTHSNAKMTGQGYTKAIGVALESKEANILRLTLQDTSAKKAEDILSALIDEYNKAWVENNNRVAVSTSKFINERLDLIERELGNVDSDISNYKSTTLVPDIQMAAGSYMQQSVENKNQTFDLTNRLALAEFMQEELAKNDISQLLPSNIGLGASALESQITTYNNMVLERTRLINNSSELNPVVADLTKSLNATHTGMTKTVENLITQLKGELKALKNKEATNARDIARNPGQAKYLLSVERQQKVKEALYLFLLQKREENEISQTFTAYNTRIIAEPDGSPYPVAPSTQKILLIAFVLGLIIPAGIIYMIETMNTRVRGRRDLDGITIPFAGELPIYKAEKGEEYIDPSRSVVVKENNVNIINEAIRVLRTNIEFMERSSQNPSKVFMSTSMNAGSGKTFIMMNLATSFAIKGKKSIVVDLDLRKATTSEYVGKHKKGLSNYLAGMINNWHEILVEGTIHPNLDVLPVGTIPPNPAELLNNDKLGELISELRNEYDYVFLDCPPVEIVADTAIVARHADITLFVVRANLMEREMLPSVERYYTEQRLPSMCIVLNGTEFRSYGRYSYHYGYGGYSKYGYRYGFRYGNENRKKG